MSNDRKQLVLRLREEGYQAGLAGRSINTNPHRFMDAYQWAAGHEQGVKERDRIKDVAAEFTRGYLRKAAEEIDAAMFSGDAFTEADNRAALRRYMGRWTRELDAYQETA